MSDGDIEIIRGGDNVFADFADPDADAKLLKATLAAEIISVLGERGLTVRAAGKVAGVAAADISRIRNADLANFTIDRLVRILGRLDRKVELRVVKAPVVGAAPL